MERKPIRFEMRLPPDLGDLIDDWRRKQPDLPARAEAARRLIELGLKAATSERGVPGVPEPLDPSVKG